MRKVAAGLLTIVGMAAVVTGVAAIYWPAAFIVGGSAICYVGLFRLDVR